MARTRGEANQALYRAQVILACWDRERSASAHPRAVLREAFLPAVRLHLCRAYGWFLLAVSGVEDTPEKHPPGRTAELPEPEAGRAVPPELQEFRLLESEGWIGEMLAADTDDTHRGGPGENLLVSDRSAPDFALAARWAKALEEIMARMDDSLAEC